MDPTQCLHCNVTSCSNNVIKVSWPQVIEDIGELIHLLYLLSSNLPRRHLRELDGEIEIESDGCQIFDESVLRFSL